MTIALFNNREIDDAKATPVPAFMTLQSLSAAAAAPYAKCVGREVGKRLAAEGRTSRSRARTCRAVRIGTEA